jgi:prepilin peptidase CpaA
MSILAMISPAAGAAGALSLAACAFDVRTRRIPNWLTFAAAALGLAFHLTVNGAAGAGSSLAGLGVGGGLFFPLFALGGMGAGDVKLMAALGAWLGPTGAAWTALYAALAGGVMAVVVALARGYMRTAFENVWTLLGFWRIAGIRPLDGLTLQTSRSPRLPYALPITAGLFATLWLH